MRSRGVRERRRKSPSPRRVGKGCKAGAKAVLRDTAARESNHGVNCQRELWINCGLSYTVERTTGPAGRFSSVFLALRRHRVAQDARLLGQPLVTLLWV